MKLVYTTGWTRKDIRTPELYQQWLRSLKPGDAVLLQQFLPAADGCLDFPFERWLFEYCKITRAGTIRGFDDHPFNPETGMATYWNSPNWWGKVFPARLVPCHSDIPAAQGCNAIGHMPVYEPLYLGSTRHVFSVNYGPGFNKAAHRIRRDYPHHYELRCDRGILLHTFSPEYEVTLPDELVEMGAKHLYSQYIEA
jgi:hypothetical protein